MLPELFKHFHVYACDHYAMGCSYRPKDFKVKTLKEGLDFYTKVIEEWRRNLKVDEDFYVVAHSLGG